MIKAVLEKLKESCWGKSALEVDNEHRTLIDILEFVVSGNNYQKAALRTANKNLTDLQTTPERPYGS